MRHGCGLDGTRQQREYEHQSHRRCEPLPWLVDAAELIPRGQIRRPLEEHDKEPKVEGDRVIPKERREAEEEQACGRERRRARAEERMADASAVEPSYRDELQRVDERAHEADKGEWVQLDRGLASEVREDPWAIVPRRSDDWRRAVGSTGTSPVGGGSPLERVRPTT